MRWKGAVAMTSASVLVLNQNYEPLNVCHARRAVVLLLRGKAEVVESAGEVFRTAREAFRIPSVIRMVYYIRRPRPKLRLSRTEVFARDGWKCVYCGNQTNDLTLDHVIPRHRGGEHSWKNLVSACKPCNHRKAGRTPSEAHMKMLHEPREPHVSPYHNFFHYLSAQDTWRKFVPGYEPSR